MTEKPKTHFPLWQYLNQPLFQRDTRTTLNPRRFWYRHRVELLERCLAKNCPAKGH